MGHKENGPCYDFQETNIFFLYMMCDISSLGCFSFLFFPFLFFPFYFIMFSVALLGEKKK